MENEYFDYEKGDLSGEELDRVIDNFIERGLLTAHWDEKLKETVYQVQELAKVEEPDLWELHVKDLQRGIYRMWQDDFVSVSFSDEGFEYDSVRLLPKIYDEKEISKLSGDDQRYVSQLKKAFEKE